jgi:hypothetical protein
LLNKDEHGAGIIGIYPLLPDETCLFLAVDFDDKTWQEDISVFRSVCKELKIPVTIERSRSGNGGHVRLPFQHTKLVNNTNKKTQLFSPRKKKKRKKKNMQVKSNGAVAVKVFRKK